MNGLMITSFCINTNGQLNFEVDHFLLFALLLLLILNIDDDGDDVFLTSSQCTYNSVYR